MEAAFDKANLNSYADRRDADPRAPRASRRPTWPPWPTPRPCRRTSARRCAKAVDGGQPLREPASSGEQRIKIALQEELSLIIRSMKGIESAYVLYDTETKAGLEPRRRPSPPRSASSRWATSRLDDDAGLVHPPPRGRRHRRPEARERHRHRPERAASIHGDPDKRRHGQREPVSWPSTQMHERDLQDEDPRRPVLHPQRDRRAERGAGSRASPARSGLVEHEPKPVAVR